jgi:head-tail adaptor
MERSATERLQAKAVGSQVAYRFRIRQRTDVTPTMRVLWTPSWGAVTGRQTLEIHGVLPFDDGRMWMLIECGRVA